jgi:NitT/TauT family transport system substrate-binding protein
MHALTRIAAAFCLLSALPHTSLAATPPHTLKVGVLAFGTLNWEIAAGHEAGLDQAQNLQLETVPLASAEAAKIALQGGSVDLIVGDWIWVAHQRTQGLDFSFAPYSISHGALITPTGSKIQGLADLKGKRLGIVGGGLDKNWLLLRALSRKELGTDLDASVDKVFGAPPLLNQQLQEGKLDALLTYWNYAAKLEAQGYRQVLSGRDIVGRLGVDAEVPALGYLFRASWAKDNPATLSGFLKMADSAKQLICASEPAWDKLAPLTQESDPKIRAALRSAYCAGRVTRFGPEEIKAAETLYGLLGPDVAAKGGLPAGVFWTPAK